ncbi:MAG: DUF3786 domain-containing protein [Lachnospiraceae bacterium]|nr:DUF3786 domain-containing protein [Lachnospiraceae bacterium]
MEQTADRAFQEMLLPAKERLRGRQPEDVAKKSGAVYDPEAALLKIASLNQIVEVTFPDFTCRQKLENWRHLLLLHYLDMADGFPVSDQLMPFGDVKDGLIRGTKFDQTVEVELMKLLKDMQPEQLQEICTALGAEIVKSKADFAAVFPFFPHYPVTLNVWFADEEFSATGKLLLSKSADHYLTVEDAVTVGDVLLKLLNS